MAITGATDLGNGVLAVTVDHNPLLSPTDVPAGSVIIDAQGNHYVKKDDGSTTNVAEASQGLRIRNESGSLIARGKLLAPVGYDATEDRILVDLADKDDPALRPAICAAGENIPDNSNAFGVLNQIVRGLNTSALSLSDQLVLGSNGDVSRPPPDVDPFTGEIQLVGSVVRVDASDGQIEFLLGSGVVIPTAADAFFLKEGSATGHSSGGAVTRATGLDVDVTAGVGYVSSGGTLTRVSWGAATVTATANILQYVIVNSSGTVQIVTSKPDLDNVILLAVLEADATSVSALANIVASVSQHYSTIHEYITEVVGPTTVSGLIATINGGDALRVDVDSGTYYVNYNRKTVPSTAPITFTYWYRNGSGGWTKVPSQTQIDASQYDDGTGTLASIPAGEWKKDILFLISLSGGGVEYHVVYAQETFASQSEAEAGVVPVPAEMLRVYALRSAGAVIQQGDTAITSIVDHRPFNAQLSPGTTSTTDHGNLSGLCDDDHTQYALADGSRGNFAPTTHASQHQDGGGDELPVASLAEAAAPTNDVSRALRPDGAGGVAFSDVAHSDLTGVGANDHHSQSHVLAGVGGLGADHTVSGLTAGQVLRATSPTAAAFQSLIASDLPSHKDEHKSGGGDAFTSSDLLEAVVKRLQVTGPVTLTLGAVADGEVLQRSGTSIIGAAAGGGDFSDGGEAGGADRTLGNTDNFDLGFLTNNLERLEIKNTGNVNVVSGELQFGGVLGITNARVATFTRLNVFSAAAGTTTVNVAATAGQTAALQQWADNTFAVLASLSVNGRLTLGGSTEGKTLQIIKQTGVDPMELKQSLATDDLKICFANTAGSFLGNVLYDNSVDALAISRNATSQIRMNTTDIALAAQSTAFVVGVGVPLGSIVAQLHVATQSNTRIPLLVREKAGQTTPLTEWQSSASALVARVKTNGVMEIQGRPVRFDPVSFFADQLDSPNTADWAVNALAPASADSNNSGLTVRLFDDTTEEGVGFIAHIPPGVTNMTLRFRSRAETAPPAARTVGLNLYVREAPDNAAVEAWSAGTQLTDIDVPANENFQYDSQTLTLASLGLVAGRVAQFELTRINPTGGTELTGDWALLAVGVEFN